MSLTTLTPPYKGGETHFSYFMSNARLAWTDRSLNFHFCSAILDRIKTS
jgi:hypothetical protein